MRFSQVDVFSATPYRGNPVAVLLDADGLDDGQMQAVARWTNLSETTFLLEPTHPDADYRVRIFTPGGELPFAGHPTLGSAHAWLEHGGVAAEGDLVQECAAGLITVRRGDGRLSFAAPPTVRDGALAPADVERIRDALGTEILDHQWVDNGPGWAVVELPDAAAVLALEPDFRACGDLKFGVLGRYPAGAECDFEIRAFFDGFEDPVTGSLNASTAQWLYRTGKMDRDYVVSQGTRLGREGRVRVSRDREGTVWIGGDTATCFTGTAR